MPIRLRITFLFAVLVMIILGFVCSGVYYFSYSARKNAIERRLTNRAITTASLLAQKEIFDHGVVRRIDSLTTIALVNKVVQAYNYKNNKIYTYSDVHGDTMHITGPILEDARAHGSSFFTIGKKEAVAYHYTASNAGMVVVSGAEDVEGKNALQTLFNILLIGFFVGIAIVLVTGYIFSSRLLLPIKMITSDVEEISAQNLTRRIETGKSEDEWYQLASTLNRLLNRLQESFELQRRFISNASHELSTPLTSISSQLEVTLQKERSATEYKEVMHSILQDVRHMSKLTQTLLEFAKASGNTGGLDINIIRIDEILLRMPSEMAKANQHYSVLLQFEKLPENEENLLVFGNEELIFTAIRNIVQNACKYSDDKKARISLETTDKNIVIKITDEGPGIPEEELRNIFQPFFRSKANVMSEGFGLGLSLAEKIIKLHKGSLDVKSDKHTGSCFTITIPSASTSG